MVHPGGTVLDGQRRILDKIPTDLHERTPLYVGSKEEVENVLNHLETGP